MPLSREALFRRLNVVRDGPRLEEWTNKAFLQYERRAWAEGLDDSPHGQKWNTSFHASSYPVSAKSCARQALYVMMDIPRVEPTPRRLRGQGTVGSAIERMLVHRWASAGLTISGSCSLRDGGPIYQTGFEVPGLWLTASVDSVLDLRPDWDAVLPVDVKSKSHEIVEQMRVGARSFDPAHYAQIQAYLFCAILFHEEMGWADMGLEPARGGIIYYVSRNDPSVTHEFYVDADGMLMAEANGRLAAWREAFLEDRLPPRPKDWKWSQPPCQFCNWKREACRKDEKAGTAILSETLGAEFAANVRPGGYDPAAIREEVLRRWRASEVEEERALTAGVLAGGTARS